MTENSDNSSNKVLLVAALVAATSFLLLYSDHRSEVSNHRKVVLARGQTVLDALTAGIRAQGRMGKYRPDRLSAVFEELADTADIVGLELSTQEGGAISSGGDTQHLLDVKPNTPLWTEDRLIMVCEPLLLGHGAGRGMGHNRPRENGSRGWPSVGEREDWRPFPEGPYFLRATLDTNAMLEEIRRDRMRFAVSTSVLLIAVLLGTAVVLSRTRRRVLQAALLVEQERTAQQEHMTHLGAGLAHETKNPLGIVRGLAQLISDSPASPETRNENRKHADTIVDEIDRTIGQINSFLALARPKTADIRPVNLEEFFQGLSPLVGSEATQKKLNLSFTSNKITIKADEELLRRAVLNLVLNSFRACKPQDEICVVADRNDNGISLSVTDTGCGIDLGYIEHVTDPYFTRFEGGSGLGLSIVKQIAQAHGWDLVISSDRGQGTRVSLDKINEVKNSGE